MELLRGDLLLKYDQDKLDKKVTEFYDEAIEEYVEEHNTEEAYEEKLNEIYGEVEVCGTSFQAGRILKELDPIMFSCGMSDNEDSIREDAENEISEDDFIEQSQEALNMENEE